MKEAERNNITNNIVKAARIIVDREKLVNETNTKLKTSAENGDLAALNEALETSIEPITACSAERNQTPHHLVCCVASSLISSCTDYKEMDYTDPTTCSLR